MIVQPVLVSGIKPVACFEQGEAFSWPSREEQRCAEISMRTGQVRAQRQSALCLNDCTFLVAFKCGKPS